MASSRDSWTREGLDLARRLGRLTPELGVLARYYYANQLSPAMRELLDRELRSVYRVAEAHPELVHFDLPGRLEGELHVGTQPDGKPVHLKIQDLAKGTLLTGATGSGKTYALLMLASALFSYLKTNPGGLLLVDHCKADLGLAVAHAEQSGLKPVIATENLPINPLEPPTGVAPRTWAGKVLSIIAWVLAATDNALVYLRGIVLSLYERARGCPTWIELIQAVKSADGLLDAVRRPLLYKLEAIAADMPELASTRHGIKVDEFERRIVYLPLFRMPREVGRLIFAWIRHASFTRRVESEKEEDDLFIIEDEINFAYAEELGAGFVANLSAVGRGLSICWIGAGQSLSIAPSLLANSNSIFVGRLTTNTDARTAADILCLNATQAQHVVSRLGPGQFIARLPGTVAAFPFTWLKPDIVPLSRAARREAEERLLKELGSKIDHEATTPARSTPVAKPEAAAPPESAEVETSVRLSGDALLVLKNCHEQPFLFMRDRATACGLTRHRLTRAKEELQKHGLVAVHELETFLPGARPRLLEVLPAGYAILQVPAKPWAGRAGRFTHTFGAHIASTYYESQGFSVEFEVPLGAGKAADVIATAGKTRIVVEVQTSADHASENFEKVGHLVDRVEFLAMDVPTLNRLQMLFRNRAGAKVIPISLWLSKLRQNDLGKGPSRREGA